MGSSDFMRCGGSMGSGDSMGCGGSMGSSGLRRLQPNGCGDSVGSGDPCFAAIPRSPGFLAWGVQRAPRSLGRLGPPRSTPMEHRGFFPLRRADPRSR